MPTYQYRCTECGNELEAVQKFTDSALTDCPDCTGQLRKVFNAVGVVFKGSGFYRTDSRADKKVERRREQQQERGRLGVVREEDGRRLFVGQVDGWLGEEVRHVRCQAARDVRHREQQQRQQQEQRLLQRFIHSRLTRSGDPVDNRGRICAASLGSVYDTQSHPEPTSRPSPHSP